MIRVIFGLLTGIAAAIPVILAIEVAGHLIFPTPPGLDFSTPEAIRENAQHISRAAMASVALAWIAGAFIGGWIAVWIARRGRWPAWVIAALVFAAAIYNLISIPSPLWLWALGLCGIALAGWCAGRLAKSPPATP